MTDAAAVATIGQPVLRVVLCDDDPIMTEALTELFSDAEGFEVVGVANDADSVASLAETLQPDVVLLDVRMPGGGGPRAARLIRGRVKETRLIAFSAHSDRQTMLGMLRAGASEFLVKGVDGGGDILDAVRGVQRARLRLSVPDTEALVADLLALLDKVEARLAATNQDLLRLGESGRDAAADAFTMMEAAADHLAQTSQPDQALLSDAIEAALASQRRVLDCLAAAAGTAVQPIDVVAK